MRLFPGVNANPIHIETYLPEVRILVFRIADTIGVTTADLAGNREIPSSLFVSFLDGLRDESVVAAAVISCLEGICNLAVKQVGDDGMLCRSLRIRIHLNAISMIIVIRIKWHVHMAAVTVHIDTKRRFIDSLPLVIVMKMESLAEDIFVCSAQSRIIQPCLDEELLDIEFGILCTGIIAAPRSHPYTIDVRSLHPDFES